MKQFELSKEESKYFEEVLFKSKDDISKQTFFNNDITQKIKPLKREVKLKAINYLYTLALEKYKYDLKIYKEDRFDTYDILLSVSDLLKTNLELNEEEIEYIYNRFFSVKNELNKRADNMTAFFIGNILKQIECHFKNNDITEKIKNIILDIKEKNKETYDKARKNKIDENIENVFNNRLEEGSVIKFLDDADRFSNYANKKIEALKIEKKKLWYKLIIMFRECTSAKPTKSFIEESKKIIKEYGEEEYKQLVLDFMNFMINLETIKIEKIYKYGNREYTNTEYTYISNTNSIKGLVWLLASIVDDLIIQLLTKLIERAYEKIPSRGATAVGIGNAALYTISMAKCFTGISHLSKLKLKIKNKATVAIIEKYLEDWARLRGVTVECLEDMSVPDFGLTI